VSAVSEKRKFVRREPGWVVTHHCLELLLRNFKNARVEFKSYCPGHLAIGDDNGGSAFVLSLADGSVHIVGIGAMTGETATVSR